MLLVLLLGIDITNRFLIVVARLGESTLEKIPLLINVKKVWKVNKFNMMVRP